jgi:hypothetical protein
LDFEMPSENLDYWPVHTIRSGKPRPDNKPKNGVGMGKVAGIGFGRIGVSETTA